MRAVRAGRAEQRLVVAARDGVVGQQLDRAREALRCRRQIAERMSADADVGVGDRPARLGGGLERAGRRCEPAAREPAEAEPVVQRARLRRELERVREVPLGGVVLAAIGRQCAELLEQPGLLPGAQRKRGDRLRQQLLAACGRPAPQQRHAEPEPRLDVGRAAAQERGQVVDRRVVVAAL